MPHHRGRTDFAKAQIMTVVGIIRRQSHCSWLNMAEIELSILQGQCLDRRIPDDAMLTREITAYEDARNAAQATIVWRFTTTKARATLHRLYPLNAK